MQRLRMKPLMVMVALLSASAAAGETPSAADTAEKIVVVGTLLAKNGLPATDRSVFLCTISENQLNLDVKDGKLVNPTATTDAQGKFTLQASGDYVKEGQMFTVGTRTPAGELIVPERGGSSLVLKLTKSGRSFAVGAVTVEK